VSHVGWPSWKLTLKQLFDRCQLCRSNFSFLPPAICQRPHFLEKPPGAQKLTADFRQARAAAVNARTVIVQRDFVARAAKPSIEGADGHAAALTSQSLQ
jgi:hypothetical protein